jgi:thioredoxin reductase
MSPSSLPIVIIGAGPVGLAAAAHVLARGFAPLVLEAGSNVGAGIRRWAHVRMFSPWEYNIDTAARALLTAQGWNAPDSTYFPSGHQVVQQYLEPLAATPELSPRIRFDARVTAVTRQRHDRMKNVQRNDAPFIVRYLEAGEEREVLAQSVIDASGTLDHPNPIGAAGIPAMGERAIRAHVFYGIPDVLQSERTRYAGKTILVVGSGHSAFNALNDLAKLSADAPGTRIHWAVRRPSLQRVFGGGENDKLKERGQLGLRIAELVGRGVLTVHPNTYIDRIENTGGGRVAWSGDVALPAVDEIIAATGFRPDFSMLEEVRLDLDPGTQAPVALAPLIDPNLHSCGTVRPHGAMELRHPDANFYVVGMKSYGRAPTFLLMTGYEQVRSIAAAIAGDWDAARRVELVLPETGVCSTQFDDETQISVKTECCENAAVATASSCSFADADAKVVGAAGCGGTTMAIDAASVAPVAIPIARKTSCCGPARN